MRKLINPKWLFAINTLPIAILFVLFYSQFDIIQIFLEENNIQFWKYFGGALGFFGLLNFAYAALLVLKKQNVSARYGILALLFYIPFLYLYVNYFDKIIPSHIPQWMLPGNIFFYAGTFLMPTLIYSVLILVVHFTSETKEHKAWVNFLIAISIPVSGYLFIQVIVPMRNLIEDVFMFNKHVALTILIVAIVVFFFFTIRGVFVVVARKSAALKKYQWLWKALIALVLPLLGLLINNGVFQRFYSLYAPMIFGDFDGLWFYILAVVNGIFVCLPALNHKIYRLLLFFGRSITFSYTLYFFWVFLPFLPLSVVAIVFAAAGLLTLVPLLLFVIHVNEISSDFAFLKSQFSKKLITGIFLSGILTIPLFVTAAYWKDKIVLGKTLEYVYSPDYSKKYKIDKNSLQKTLGTLKQYKDRKSPFTKKQTPYLSSYFNWLVLDNLTLSDAKIDMIEKIFFVEETPGIVQTKSETENEIGAQHENSQNKTVNIRNISTESVYDRAQKAWKSWVHLEITNENNENGWFSEYATTVNLPEGCWISDYYLYVEGRKEPGVLAEKKAAMWVFSNVRNENRDPGILYYLTGNKIAFRVFPFAKNETRKTGIEFLHKEPMTLRIDNHIVELGSAEETTYENVENEKVAYVSSQQKQTLNSVYRKPYFHFLVDVSKGKDKYSSDFEKRIHLLLKNHAEFSENAKISFVNSYVNSFPFDNHWKQHYSSQIFEGGFYLDRALKMALFQAYKNNSRPLIVVITDRIENAILDKDFSDFKFAFPESNLFFNLRADGELQPHSFMGNPSIALFEKPECLFCETVLEYKLSDNSIAYLPDNSEPSIVFKKNVFEMSAKEIQEKNWQSALLMQAKWSAQILHPKMSDKEWLEFVKYSFISKIMTPATSYLVVEDEAQKAILKKKQEEILSSKRTLDFDLDPQRMSEPGLWILLALFGVAWGFQRMRKHKQQGSPKFPLPSPSSPGSMKRLRALLNPLRSPPPWLRNLKK